jgi:hypothetical protein
MKLSPPTTKTQKPQRYLTLLYRHLALGYLNSETKKNCEYWQTKPFLKWATSEAGARSLEGQFTALGLIRARWG